MEINADWLKNNQEMLEYIFIRVKQPVQIRFRCHFFLLLPFDKSSMKVLKDSNPATCLVTKKTQTQLNI
jgi:hypothetical protein